jgi:hypothetical protein
MMQDRSTVHHVALEMKLGVRSHLPEHPVYLPVDTVLTVITETITCSFCPCLVELTDRIAVCCSVTRAPILSFPGHPDRLKHLLITR